MSANNYTAVKGKHFVQGQDSGSSGKSDFYANSYLGLILLSFNDLTGTCEFNKCFLVPPSTTISSHYRKRNIELELECLNTLAFYNLFSPQRMPDKYQGFTSQTYIDRKENKLLTTR